MRLTSIIAADYAEIDHWFRSKPAIFLGKPATPAGVGRAAPSLNQFSSSRCYLQGLQSIVCDGCIISGGTVWSSILSPGVIVEKDAVVEQSVIFDDVIIEPGARIRRAIVDKGSRVRAGASIGYDREADKRRGYTISDNGIVVIAKGTDITRTEPSLF